MEIDLNMIKKLQNTDDEALKNAIRSIAEAVGANNKQINNAVNSVSIIKKRMSRMSDEEIRRQVNKQVNKHIDKIGEDKAEEILKQLKL